MDEVYKKWKIEDLKRKREPVLITFQIDNQASLVDECCEKLKKRGFYFKVHKKIITSDIFGSETYYYVSLKDYVMGSGTTPSIHVNHRDIDYGI